MSAISAVTTTQKEIFAQYDALKKTLDCVLGQKESLLEYLRTASFKKIVFVGCGSSYSLAKSAAETACLRLPQPAYAYSAGDLLINYELYKPMLDGSLFFAISRSGSTSEVVRLLNLLRSDLNAPILSVCAKENTDAGGIAGYSVELPWAFDESVCQTRCVSNLYLADALIIGVLSGDEAMAESFRGMIDRGADYLASIRDDVDAACDKSWDNIVVLADGELCGIAEEGALAFTEICLLPSRYFHLLDVRHGPIVLINDKTLVLAALAPGQAELQYALLKDIKARGATLAVLSDHADTPPYADLSVQIPSGFTHVSLGLPFINIAQTASLFKALKNGVNPDAPTGLDAWIKL